MYFFQNSVDGWWSVFNLENTVLPKIISRMHWCVKKGARCIHRTHDTPCFFLLIFNLTSTLPWNHLKEIQHYCLYTAFWFIQTRTTTAFKNFKSKIFFISKSWHICSYLQVWSPHQRYNTTLAQYSSQFISDTCLLGTVQWYSLPFWKVLNSPYL